MNTGMQHNRRNMSDKAQSQIREEFIVALRRGRPEHSGDSEGVLVHVEGQTIMLVLDDGEQLVFDAGELRSAVGEA